MLPNEMKYRNLEIKKKQMKKTNQQQQNYQIQIMDGIDVDLFTWI